MNNRKAISFWFPRRPLVAGAIFCSLLAVTWGAQQQPTNPQSTDFSPNRVAVVSLASMPTLVHDPLNSKAQIKTAPDGWHLSLDQGATWSPIPNVPGDVSGHELRVLPDSNAVIAFASNQLQVLALGSAQWREVALPPLAKAPDAFFDIRYYRGTLLVAAGSEVWQSAKYEHLPWDRFNAGSWKKLFDFAHPITAISVLSDSGVVNAGTSDGQIWSGTDDLAAADWKLASQAIGSVIRITADPMDHRIAQAEITQDQHPDAILESRDGGSSFPQFHPVDTSPVVDPAVEAATLSQIDRQSARQPLAACRYTVSPSSQDASSLGATVSFNVTASASSCVWKTTIFTRTSPIQSLTTSGKGSGTATFRIAANTGSAARTFTPTVAGVGVTIKQSGSPATNPPCSLALMTANPVAATSGTLSVRVTKTSGCGNITISSTASWLTLDRSSIIQNGDTVVTGRYPANAGVERLAEIRIAATGSLQPASIAIRQLAGQTPCVMTVSTANILFNPSGGVQYLPIKMTNADCSWTATTPTTNAPDLSWLSLDRSIGKGSYSLKLTAKATSASGRMAKFNVNGVQITVSQEASIKSDGCRCTSVACGANMQLGATQTTFTSIGGRTYLSVFAPNSCSWTLNSSAGFLQFPNGPEGIGAGRVLVNVPVNSTGATRTARITSPQATPANNGQTAKVDLTQQR